MPIDKGGRHMLVNRHAPYDNSTNSTNNPLASFYLCDPRQLFSTCVLNFKLTRNKNKNVYVLDNGSERFTSPVSGKIIKVQTFPPDLDIGLKREQKLSEDDQIEFVNGDIKDDYIFITLVILCPLMKDDE
jgi:hypothetical protein